MSRHYTLKPKKFQIELRTSEKSSVHGGLLSIVGLLRQSGLIDWVKECEELKHRKNTSRGYDPVVYVLACLLSFCSGGGSLADVEELNSDKALLKLLGIERFPDQSALGEWLRSMDEDGHQALKVLNRRFCSWILKQAKQEDYCYGGNELEWFFDDTQIEVSGKKFEGAGYNYNGDMALDYPKTNGVRQSSLIGAGGKCI